MWRTSNRDTKARKRAKRLNLDAGKPSADQLDAVEVMPEVKNPTSVVSQITFWLSMFLIACMGYWILQVWIPSDTSQLAGYNQPNGAPDLPAMVEQGMQMHKPVAITEEQLNQFLASSVIMEQCGMLGQVSTPVGVGVKLHNGYMEVVIERKLFGVIRHTMALYVTIKYQPSFSGIGTIAYVDYSNGQNFVSDIPYGVRIGSLELPQGYAQLVLPAYDNLVEAYNDFLTDVLDNGNTVLVTEGGILIAPTSTGSNPL